MTAGNTKGIISLLVAYFPSGIGRDGHCSSFPLCLDLWGVGLLDVQVVVSVVHEVAVDFIDSIRQIRWIEVTGCSACKSIELNPCRVAICIGPKSAACVVWTFHRGTAV